MQKLLLPLLFFSSFLSAQCPTLIWADEFDGTSLNTDDWNFQIGDGCDINLCGWGNNEQQWYQSDNVSVADGELSIVLRNETVGGRSYTSGRINTKNKVDLKYGYFETRMKVPPGRGLWPAFWMLSTDEVYGGWPQSGEIDIMEWVGREPDNLFGTLHYGQPFPNNSMTGSEIELRNEAWSDEYHTYAVHWEENKISWYVDGYLFGTKQPGNLGGERWPFDQEFHFLLNMAIGGTFGGTIGTGFFPAEMKVDYVRAYDSAPAFLRGARDLENGATNVGYSLGNIPDGATITWTVPEGAIITDDSNPAGIVVDFTGDGGTITATITSDCGDYTLSTEVYVAPGLRFDYSFENYDDEALAIYEFSNGPLTEVANPGTNEVNGSALCGEYVRDVQSLFDVIVYDVTTLVDADDYVEGTMGFSMDIYSDAFAGKEIVIQLETAAALPENYPTGRHSRYRARTTKQGEWERLTFELLDEPDNNATSTGIKKLVILIDPNRTTGDTFFLDNLDSYSTEPSSLGTVRQLDFPLTARPNPASEDMVLSFELPQPASLTADLIDATGRVVLRQKMEALAGANQVMFNVDGLPGGVYFARLQLQNGIRTMRVIVN
ncbi:MAG: family 16 glycosylhydrolase [Lewinella sp.]